MRYNHKGSMDFFKSGTMIITRAIRKQKMVYHAQIGHKYKNMGRNTQITGMNSALKPEEFQFTRIIVFCAT